ncbi:catalase [Nocardioides bizhenqiangii]|uniref:Catalase n=1 Tax=Nocardioides bizhenqiangii TaxID=3095076 RepID=A0ABZ0ZM48_9ACTN|nr:catalase [Nocardioides sp. HM61]WQQ25327.1 catalase [Nocardioides sp. HM61]
MTSLPPATAIDRLRAAFGRPAAHDTNHRTLHAKGAFYAGTFTATPRAAELCTAGHLQGSEVPILVRWSNGAGNPRASDKAPDVRGMAVSFKLPDGTATDLLGQTAPRFPVRTPEAFVAMTEAAIHPRKLPGFLLRNPHAVPALVANARAKALVPPASYAVSTYHAVHAYRWLAADGTSNWVRYVLRPRSSTAPDGTFTGRDRLREEIAARLAAGPVTYTLEVHLADDGDDPHDPTSVWEPRETIDAGTLTVTAVADDPEADGGVVVFDPTRIVDGIELSDDPILRYRPQAYSESVERRSV